MIIHISTKDYCNVGPFQPDLGAKKYINDQNYILIFANSLHPMYKGERDLGYSQQ